MGFPTPLLSSKLLIEVAGILSIYLLKVRDNVKLSTNWAWELNFYATHSIIIFDVSIKATGDHQGLFVMLGLLGYATDVNIYDVRHEGELYGSL